MKKLWLLIAGLYILPTSSIAADKVVVVPLGGAVGDATPDDVVKGRTFSSEAAGKGVVGTLEIRNNATLYTNSIGMKFSLIPAGSFVMGSPAGTGDASHYPFWPYEAGRDGDEKQHVVTLTESFYMQTTEVTQGQWEQVMGSNPSLFTSCGSNCPVENVSWGDAQNFIDALNALEERRNCNTSPNNCYSLPTESQWEYSARGGTVTAFYSGSIASIDCTPLDPNLDKIGWYCGNHEVSYSGCWDESYRGGAACAGTHPVAQKKPNNWGLYDMSGNVWEWCQDRYGNYPEGPVIDFPGPDSGSERVFRGGSWYQYAGYARSAKRYPNLPTVEGNDLGFRLVLPAGQ